MKKYRIIFSALFLALLLSSVLLWKLEGLISSKSKNEVTSNYTFASISNSEYNAMLNGDTFNIKTNTSVGKNSISNNIKLSRGGTLPKSISKRTYSSKIETLDWWKEARYVFSVNSIAEVTDVYTNKSFKVKRTMGTNHADAEALTPEDTKIIKDIWGGFSWERRPVIVKIAGRRLAASMSGMPHAGIDSAPAFKVVDNRSLGYGKGENLDVIKGNKMDGHFDIHFLNSTRHKDGKKDPEHQMAILRALSK